MYAAFVVGHHLVHIGQSQTKAFDVVEAAGGYTVELLEDVLQVVLADADAVVLDADADAVFFPRFPSSPLVITHPCCILVRCPSGCR